MSEEGVAEQDDPAAGAGGLSSASGRLAAARGDLAGDGVVIAGRYRLTEQVGRGSMGVVWRAHDELLDRMVAVKQLLPTEGLSEEMVRRGNERALREARLTARLQHPNAVTVHDVVEHNGQPCLVMEFVAARSLSSVLAEHGVRSPREVAAIGRQVAEALDAAHRAGIVHRDIKPDNILLGEDGSARITDFGISRALGDGTLTGPGIVVGTPAYLAPEVATGGEAGLASDVFSLGATLYAAVEGEPPFGVDENAFALLQRVAEGVVEPPTRAGELTDTLMWFLRKDPVRRPTMAQAAAALRGIAEGGVPPTPPTYSWAARPPLDHAAPDPAAPPVENHEDRHEHHEHQGDRRPTGHPATAMLPAMHLPRRTVQPKTVVAGLFAAGLLAAGIITGVLISAKDHPTDTANPPVTRGQHIALPPATPLTTTPDNAGCAADYALVNAWPGGDQAMVTVRNAGNTPVRGWTVSWTLPAGQSVSQIWNGALSQQGGTVTVASLGYNGTINANGTTTFGFLSTVANNNAADKPVLTCQAQH